jgi:hypothetical protein
MGIDGGAGAGLRDCGFWAIIVGQAAPTELLKMVQYISLISHSAPFSYIL